MKKLFFLLLITASCAPYHRMDQKVAMRYSVGIYYHENFEGSILCKDIRFNGDTVTLEKAGYFPKLLKQRRLTDIRFIGDRSFMVIDLDINPISTVSWNPIQESTQNEIYYQQKGNRNPPKQ